MIYKTRASHNERDRTCVYVLKITLPISRCAQEVCSKARASIACLIFLCPGTTSGRRRTVYSDLHKRLRWDASASLALPWIRPSLLNGTLRKIEVLSARGTAVQFTINDTVGVVITNMGLPPDPVFNCTLFGCTCQKEAVYYNIDGGASFGCAPPAAQAWWAANHCEVLGPQPGVWMRHPTVVMHNHARQCPTFRCTHTQRLRSVFG